MKRYALVFATVAVLFAGYLLSGGGFSVPSGLGAAIGLAGGEATRVAQGERLASPAIALAGGGSADVRAVSSFFEPTVETETPAATEALADMQGCAFRPPRAGEVIGNVHVGRGGLPTPVSALSRRILAERALAEIRAARGGGAVEGIEDPAPMQAVDVFITERNAPVYLILQSSEGDVLWNVQPSPGARIAHIAVIAAGQVGLMVPGRPSAQVLRVAEHPDCAIPPAREPDPTWDIFRQGARLEDYAARFEAYDTWFRLRFGIGAEANAIGAHETSHALVGPVPAIYDKVMQTRLAGATIAVTDADLVAVGPGEARTGRAQAAVERLVAAAAGGNPARLAFATVARQE